MSGTLSYSTTPSSTEPVIPVKLQLAALALILLANVLLKAPNLGHPSLKPMDESFHAVVARNLMYDPFKPTLIREPYLPYDPTDWLSNHVWLHKPVLPLWIIAGSFSIFGVNALALRLPSLILSTFAVALTFLIARRVYSPVVGLLAAAIQAIVPTIGMIVHGYVFSDAIDINLLFWTELSLYLMLRACAIGRNPRSVGVPPTSEMQQPWARCLRYGVISKWKALWSENRWIWLSGAAAGAGFMSKTFPAMFVFAPLMLLMILRHYSLALYSGRGRGRGAAATLEESESPDGTLSQRTGRGSVGASIFGWVCAFILIAAPWNIYCAIRFPTEFKAEYGLILTHLSADVENWASPWDRLWFQHLPSALYLFWTICLIGTLVLTIRAIQLKKWEWLFAPVWAASVLIPFTLATSKTPSATLPAWPALMIGGGFLIWRACRGYVVEASTMIVLLVAMIFFRGSFIQKGWGITEPFAIMKEAGWIGWHLLAGLAGMSIALAADWRLRTPASLGLAVAVALGVAILAYHTAALAKRVERLSEDPVSRNMMGAITVAKWAMINLPSDAVIDGPPEIGTRNVIMFYADRTAATEVPYPREERVYHIGWHLGSLPPGDVLFQAHQPGGGWILSDTVRDRPYKGVDGRPTSKKPE